jgi:hypothetical protein
VRGFGHDLPTITQHARNVFIHCLHARQQPLPVVFPRPISLICERLHFHLRHRRFCGALGVSKRPILGEHIANRKIATRHFVEKPAPRIESKATVSQARSVELTAAGTPWTVWPGNDDIAPVHAPMPGEQCGRL